MISEEIEKFNRLAKNWWNEQGESKMLHKMAPFFVRYLKNFVPALANQHIVDIGCGGGILCEQLAKQGAIVTGIDPAEKSIEVAHEHWAVQATEYEGQITYANQFVSDYIDQCDDQTKQFDMVCCFEVLEHVDQPDQLIEQIAQLVKPGGWVFFSTLNRTKMAYLQAIVGAEYLLRLVEPGTHQHGQFIKPAELKRWCEKNRLAFKDLTGIGYNLIQQQFLMRQDIAVNYMCAYKFDDSYVFI